MQALQGPEGPKSKPKRDFRTDQWGLVAISPLMAIIGAILTVIIGFFILAELAPTFFTAVGDLVSAMTAGGTNSTVGDAILAVFVIVVAIVAVVAFVQLVLRIVDRTD